MKFETKKQNLAENSITENINNNVVGNSSSSSSSNIKKINPSKAAESNCLSSSFTSSSQSAFSSSIYENEKSPNLYSSMSSSPVHKITLASDNWTNNYLEKQQKVKSLSKNWELIANKNNSKVEITAKPACTRPTKVIEKIERLNSNNLIQLIAQQQHELSDLVSGNNSDDNEMSKDDGFETQSNASSSQTSDTNSVQSIKLNDLMPIDDLLSCNNIAQINNEYIENMSPENEAESKKLVDVITDDRISKLESLETETKEKSTCNNNNNNVPKINTIVTIVTKNKCISNPQVTVTKRPSKNDNDNQNHHESTSTSSLDESTKRKSGSMTGLYLSDTAATKARKAETKNSLKTSNSLNIQMQSGSINNINNTTICSINNNGNHNHNQNHKHQKGVHRKNSNHQKSTEKLNLHSNSTISLCGKNKKNNSKDTSVFDRLAKTSSKSLKLK